MRPYAFGVDIGGTAIKFGFFSTVDGLLETWQIPTNTSDHGEHVLPEALASVAAKLEERGIPWEQCEGVGMGVPGPVAEDGTVYKCVNLGWDVFNIPMRIRMLEPRIHRFRITNDVNAAALGELWKGGAMGYSTAFMVTLGTGVGGGLVVNGKINNGVAGAAGEIGHLMVNPSETEHCRCGRTGCLEQYCSATGLLRQAKKTLENNPEAPTMLRDFYELTAKDICDAARQGDAMAIRLLANLGNLLGWALTAVASIVNPEVIIIGGGLSNAGDVLMKPIEDGFRSHAAFTIAGTKFARAELRNLAGITGCVKMLY